MTISIPSLLLAHPALASDWKAVEMIETYAISGDTGIALYRSIGEKGPKVGVGRAIAYEAPKASPCLHGEAPHLPAMAFRRVEVGPPPFHKTR